MRIFICWSGPLSKAVALVFRDWINDVLQLAKPWMSEEDIPSGTIWFDGINRELEETKYGIICVTQQNQTAPWLLWEAGALFGGIKDGRRREVVPLLVDLVSNDLISPLNKFQAVRATSKRDMLRMLSRINEDMDSPISSEKMAAQLDRCWDEWSQPVLKAIENVPDVRIDGSSRHTFKEAAERFLRLKKDEEKNKRLHYALKWAGTYIDALPVDQVDDVHLAKYKEDRIAGTIKPPPGERVPQPAQQATLHKEIQVIKQVVTSAKKWDWIDRLPLITPVPKTSGRKQYVLTWDEQERLLENLPPYARGAVLFVANTGVPRALLRDLEWAWLTTIPSLDIPVFHIPEAVHGRHGGRLILLNSVARQVVRQQRDFGNDRYVFTSKRGGQIWVPKFFGPAWKRAGLPTKGDHSLGISNMVGTFENRLEKAGVNLEERAFLLWNEAQLRSRSDRHPDYRHLLDCLERVATRPPKEDVQL